MSEIVSKDGVIVSDQTSTLLVRRPFEYFKGDARRLDFDDAVAYAARRFIDRGCRQQVRRELPGLYRDCTTWLIQDI